MKTVRIPRGLPSVTDQQDIAGFIMEYYRDQRDLDLNRQNEMIITTLQMIWDGTLKIVKDDNAKPEPMFYFEITDDQEGTNTELN